MIYNKNYGLNFCQFRNTSFLISRYIKFKINWPTAFWQICKNSWLRIVRATTISAALITFLRNLDVTPALNTFFRNPEFNRIIYSKKNLNNIHKIHVVM